MTGALPTAMVFMGILAYTFTPFLGERASLREETVEMKTQPEMASGVKNAVVRPVSASVDVCESAPSCVLACDACGFSWYAKN